MATRRSAALARRRASPSWNSGPWTLDGPPLPSDAGSVSHDRNGLEVLSREQCLELLQESLVGRVVFTECALPAALPVNFALLDEDVVFRTATGSKLAAALAKAVVAFEVDDLDAIRHTGWSVLVQGWATLLTRPDDLTRAHALSLQPWAPGERWHFVRIRSEIVSGRRIIPQFPLPAEFASSCGGGTDHDDDDARSLRGGGRLESLDSSACGPFKVRGTGT